MPTPKLFNFTFQEVAEMMIRDAGVKEGHWGIHVRFGLQASNIGASDDDLRPAAIIPIMEIGLQQFDKPSNLTVDAAVLTKKHGR